MGKEKPGFLTPKAIANRIKAKGLQKLRWYCQMCQKQCRDENGFKCHAMSESHQRQLLLFAENSSKFMDDFSSQFSREYVNTLKRRFGTKRVHSNVVYQEYISDRNHIHMNATRWLTLSDYVKYLGRQGICIVDETEKGWFVTYIDRDPETLKRQAEADAKKKLDLDDRQRQQMYLEKQMERAKDQEVKVVEPTELKKSEDEVIKINFMKTRALLKQKQEEESEKKPRTSKSVQEEAEEKEEEEEKEETIENLELENEKEIKKEIEKEEEKKSSLKVENDLKDTDKFKVPLIKEQTPSTSKSSVFKAPNDKPEKRKQSALDEIVLLEEKKREKMNRKDYWLHKDIVVKVITKKVGEKYYNKKGVITDVIDLYTGVVKMIDSGAVIKLDQAHLETVLPAIGKKVLILNGAYRGEVAIMEDINQDEFYAQVSIASGPLKGRVVKKIQYEDISKLNHE